MISSEVGGELALPRAASSQRLWDPCQLLSTHGLSRGAQPAAARANLTSAGLAGPGGPRSTSPIPLHQHLPGFGISTPCIPWDSQLPTQDMAMGHWSDS